MPGPKAYTGFLAVLFSFPHSMSGIQCVEEEGRDRHCPVNYSSRRFFRLRRIICPAASSILLGVISSASETLHPVSYNVSAKVRISEDFCRAASRKGFRSSEFR